MRDVLGKTDGIVRRRPRHVKPGFFVVSLNEITVDNSSPDSVLTMLPEVEARTALAGRALFLRVLRPAYPALGTGTLRVLRVREVGQRTEVVAGYDGYERLEITKP